MDTAIFRIDGMHCDGCAERIRALLGREPGVREAKVSFADASAQILHNPHTVNEARLRQIIQTGGFDVVERTV